jgi:hypothetical protein
MAALAAGVGARPNRPRLWKGEHRSFVTATGPHADLFPYDDRLTLPVRSAVDPARPRWWITFFR